MMKPGAIGMRSNMTSDGRNSQWLTVVAALAFCVGLAATPRARADGMVVAPRDYKGSLEERAQEAIILFHAGEEGRQATEDLILKIRVEGAAESFAWVIALPDTPTTGAEDSKLFEELHRYVQARKASSFKAAKSEAKSAAAPGPAAVEAPVEVISRKDVGSYDVAVVRENQQGALQGWLADNGYRRVEDAEELIDFYRKKGYVFACIRVREAALRQGTPVDLHPLRFSFKTGGRDGVYFPMRLTGLQSEPFDVNLYVLYGKWLNDRVNGFGFAHRGFALNWRDFDSPDCEPNAGKAWSDPAGDPYLKAYAGMVPNVTKLCQKLHPGERYYLTNLKAIGLVPRDVREWPDDLWLFPYYTDKATVPYDAREGGPASAAYRGRKSAFLDENPPTPAPEFNVWRSALTFWGVFAALTVLGVLFVRWSKRFEHPFGKPPGEAEL
jgi:hypothetical protein